MPEMKGCGLCGAGYFEIRCPCTMLGENPPPLPESRLPVVHTITYNQQVDAFVGVEAAFPLADYTGMSG